MRPSTTTTAVSREASTSCTGASLLCVSAWPKVGSGFVANAVLAALLVAGERFRGL
jgi:hypothetical protein